MSVQDWAVYAVTVVLLVACIVYGKKYQRLFFCTMLGYLFIEMFFQRALDDWYFVILGVVLSIDILGDVVIRMIVRSYEKKIADIDATVDERDITEAGRQAYMRDNPFS